MGFFIRKAFKAGPVRFNLSKGGIGVSAGITGARIGLNRRGAYVYGGRHGLYYREQLTSGRRKNRRSQQLQPAGVKSMGGAADIFVDTGSTYPAIYSGLKTHPLPDLKERPHWSRNILLWLIVVFVAVFSVIVHYLLLLGLSFTGFGVLLYSVYRDQKWRKKGQAMVESLTKIFEESPAKVNIDTIRSFTKNAPEAYTERFMPDLYSVLLQIAVEKPDKAHIDKFNQIENILPVSSEFATQTKRALLSRHLDAVLEDHLLSKDEEQEIRELINKLKLPEDFAKEEFRYLNLASAIRHEMQMPLASRPASIPLVRGETCYAEFKNTRLLEERVLSRFQQNRVQYRKLGYEVQLQGTLTLTDRRMVITGRGSREYRLNRIADVITDLEANVIELIMTNRKNPVFLSHPTSILVSTILEKIIRNF